MKLAVFDVDGTLVDSREVILRAAQEAAAEVGLPIPAYDQVRQIVGLSLADALRMLAPELTGTELTDFVTAYQNAFLRMHATPGFHEPLYAGAEDTLKRLKREGWTVAMATGKSRRGGQRWMAREGWADIFTSTHCADDGPGKPDPAMVLAAMKIAGATPAQTVMIGDTSHDMLMAVNASVRPQGVAWGFHTADEVLAAGALHVATNVPELDEELDRFALAL